MHNDPELKIPISIELVNDLEARGVKLEEEHTVGHFFKAKKGHAAELSEAFTNSGFTVECIEELDGNEIFGVHLLHAIDENAILRAIRQACKHGDAAGIEYDGWDVDVSRWKLKSSDN